MSKHYKAMIDLYVADEGYGGFYDPDMGYDFSRIAEDEDDPDYDEVFQMEIDTAARLSWAYNQTLNVPTDVLHDPVFRTWIENAARDYQRYVANLEKS